MANITDTNADKNFKSTGNSGSITMDRQRMAILQMMQKDPQMMTGYLIGNAIGKKYWGDKQAKSRAEANFMVLHPNATRDQFNQYYKAIKSGMSRNDALAQIGFAPMREYGKGDTGLLSDLGASAGSTEALPDTRSDALDAFKNGDVYGTGKGRVVADPKGYYGLSAPSMPAADNIPRTPQQSGQVPVTNKNAGLIGGMVDPQKAYQAMENKATYNPGNTPTGYAAYNGVRDQGNVMGGNSNPNNYDYVPGYDNPIPATYDYIPGAGSSQDVINSGLSAAQDAVTRTGASRAAAEEVLKNVPPATSGEDGRKLLSDALLALFGGNLGGINLGID